MKEYQKIEAKAQQLVTAGAAANIDEAIDQVVSEDPELYRKSLEEGAGATLSEEVTAALAKLSEEDRAEIERKAMALYLGGKVATENDSYVQAMLQTPSAHRTIMETSHFNSPGEGDTPSDASLPGMVPPERRAGQSRRLVTSADAIRADTRKKLKTLAELGTKGPWEQLREISLQIVEQYPDMDEKEAFRTACIDNPALFQQWQDLQPKSSRVPLAQV